MWSTSTVSSAVFNKSQVVLVLLVSVVMWHGMAAQAAAGSEPDSPGNLQQLRSNVMDSVTSQSMNRNIITCELLIEGGTNDTEISLYGTSVARAHLNCTGGVLVVTFHPVLAPFASQFKGVALGVPDAFGKPFVHALNHSARVDGIPVKYRDCVPIMRTVAQNPPSLLTVCESNPSVLFTRARVVDIPRSKCASCERRMSARNASEAQPLSDKSDTDMYLLMMTAIFLKVPGFVHFQDPHFVNMPIMTLRTVPWSRVTVNGGMFDRTGGMFLNSMLGGPAFRFAHTRFTNNAAIFCPSPFGGAVTVLLGHAEFQQCVFENNTADTLKDVAAGDVMAKIGLGGAVMLSAMGMGVDHASLVFVGCKFVNNTALEGGAVACPGGAATFRGCTFNNNRAARQGPDIFAGLGAALRIVDSSINVSSHTVQWDRDNASQCFRGEYVGALDHLCRRCPAATYSLGVPATNCSACPLNAQCPGGDVISPDAGFWRAGDESVQVLSCPRAAACLEGGTCATGHGGTLCGKCDPGFSLSIPFNCAKCSSKALTVALFVGSFVVLLALTGIGIQLALATSTSSQGASDWQAANDASAGDVFKLLTLFLQYVFILGGLPVPWPPFMRFVFSGAGWLFASQTGTLFAWAHSSFECMLGGKSVPAEVLKLLIYLCMPVAVASVELLIFACIHSFCRRKASSQTVQYYAVVLLVAAFFTFPVWVRTVFSLFSCQKVQDTALPYSLWWVPNMSQPCYQGYHKLWALGLGVPCLFLCCAYPSVLFAWLWCSRSRKLSPSAGSSTALDWVTRVYAAHAYGWEAVLMTQTIAVSVFATQIGNYASVLLAEVHLVVSLLLLLLVRPYATLLLHRVHAAALCCLLADVFVGLLVFAPAPSSLPATVGPSAWPLSVAQVAAAVVALALNACFVIWCCVLTVMKAAQHPAWKRVGGALVCVTARVFNRQALPVARPSRR